MSKDPEHVCRAPGCDRARESWALTCMKCWLKVPQELKDKLHEARHESGLQAGVKRGMAAYAVMSWLAGGQENLGL